MKDKLSVAKELVLSQNISMGEVAFIGDDLGDVELCVTLEFQVRLQMLLII